jgi:hypothetical protein
MASPSSSTKSSKEGSRSGSHRDHNERSQKRSRSASRSSRKGDRVSATKPIKDSGDANIKKSWFGNFPSRTKVKLIGIAVVAACVIAVAIILISRCARNEGLDLLGQAGISTPSWCVSSSSSSPAILNSGASSSTGGSQPAPNLSSFRTNFGSMQQQTMRSSGGTTFVSTSTISTSNSLITLVRDTTAWFNSAETLVASYGSLLASCFVATALSPTAPVQTSNANAACLSSLQTLPSQAFGTIRISPYSSGTCGAPSNQNLVAPPTSAYWSGGSAYFNALWNNIQPVAGAGALENACLSSATTNVTAPNFYYTYPANQWVARDYQLGESYTLSLWVYPLNAEQTTVPSGQRDVTAFIAGSSDISTGWWQYLYLYTFTGAGSTTFRVIAGHQPPASSSNSVQQNQAYVLSGAPPAMQPGVYDCVTNSTISTEVWSLVTVTYDNPSTTLTVYINGTPQCQIVSSTLSWPGSGSDLMIGSIASSGSYAETFNSGTTVTGAFQGRAVTAMKGFMADLFLNNVALSAVNVTALYTNPLL